MLQKAYEQAKSVLVSMYVKTPHTRLYWLPVEVRVAIFKMLGGLTHEESMKLYKGQLTVGDLERFQAPDCHIK